MRFALAVAILAIGCSSKLPQPDADVQDACSFSAYKSPGCGSEAVLESVACGPDSGCGMTVCTCDGQTLFAGCSYSSVPFASFGPCDAGADGPSPSDGSSDALVYPLCSFISAVPPGSQCNLRECVTGDPDGGTDANSLTCGNCPDGYVCAVYCPTPLGGCGAPYWCCPTH